MGHLICCTGWQYMSAFYYTKNMNRKWTGSPKKLQKKEIKEIQKIQKKGEFIPPEVTDESSILHGWHFKCTCGASGDNYDDGKRSLQCNICKLWMHNKCNEVPEKYNDLLTFFYRRRVWVCASCKKGKYQYLGEHWKIPNESEITETKVKFDDHYIDLPCVDPGDITCSIKEQEFNKNALPMLRRRNAEVTSLAARLRRRNADCELSLNSWLKYHENEE